MSSIGYGDIGPLGDGSRSENLRLTYRSGTLSLSGAGGIGISAETMGGNGRSIPRGKSVPGGFGGRGGDIDILVEADATIRTAGEAAHGVQASSLGGDGGNGGDGRVLGPSGKPGGDGGAAGAIAIANRGSILTSGTGAFGLFVRNVGGRGGNGGNDKGIAYSRGGRAGEAGVQFEITLENAGSIATTGENGIGIFAKSLGGGGGGGGNAKGGVVSIGGNGGNSGDGGDIVVTNSGTVSTAGRLAPGLSLETTGGGGGAGGSALAVTPSLFNVALGGDAGSSGDGGQIKAINNGTIVTRGEQSQAIKAASSGGGGGTAGAASVIGSIGLFSLGLGGNAGDGGRGGAIEITNNGTLETFAAQAEGILATSTGGGGGQGGAAKVLGIASLLKLGFGGSGGAGGDGGPVTIANGGRIATHGAQSTAISALSIGGGGGAGGVADVVSVSPGFNLQFAIGGTGGGGGHGGAAHVHNGGGAAIVTEGAGAIGIKAQSIGNGGGNGGVVSSSALTLSPVPANAPLSGLTFNMALGGNGGNGGNGGPVTVGNLGTIATSGAFADGIFAQSAGRGGGDGGFALTRSLTVGTGNTITITPTIGGKGGSGGRGGGVLVDNSGGIATTGDHAMGILAQSLGGGGGKGGGVFTSIGAAYNSFGERWLNPTQIPSYSLALSIGVGGEGGSGNSGDTVTVKNAGRISTAGAGAFGIAAQSIGGGGGIGGNSQTLTGGGTTVAANIAVGGKGGAGNHGGRVEIGNTGDISTRGAGSAAIFAQSVGGGGGHGGETSALSSTLYQSIFAALDTVGGVVALKRALDLAKQDPEFLKSWGQKTWDISVSVNAGISVGGNGRGGGNGGEVKVENTRSLETAGQRSPGVFAQSVGGGGGNGGAAGDGDETETVAANILQLAATVGQFGLDAKGLAAFKALGLSFATNIGIGGQGGAAGNGGGVSVSNAGTISTGAAASPGILAQSIGGGGGTGGKVSDDDDGPKDQLASLLDVLPLAPSGTITIGVGGAGGASGTGGTVTVSNTGGITTSGSNADAILAQSIGGGGGNGDASKAAGESTLNVVINVGGKAGSAGDGGKVAINLDAGELSTRGAFSSGVVAQSVGGGGGKAAEVTLHAGAASFMPGGRLSVGGVGASGRGGEVSVKADATILTAGEQSHGIVAQSIGGGGGIIAMPVIPLDDDQRPSYAAPAVSQLALSLGTRAGYGGNGGRVEVGVMRDLRTQGANAFGILAQSIGTGGGLIGVPARRAEAGTATVVLGGQDDAGGHGGDVDVRLSSGASIATSGRNAHGIVAQSIGGGGGVVALSERAGAVTVGSVANGNSYGDAGRLGIAVQGTIATSGAGAAGVLAQSIGAGGGITGDAASVSYKGNIVSDAGFTSGGGEGGAIGIAVLGRIATAGANAPAILAMSLGSGAVFSDQGILLKRPAAAVGNSGRRVTIEISAGAQVVASGANSPGIYAVSLGNSGTGVGGVYRGEPIAISVGTNAALRGGSGELGAGISTHTTALTTITNSGTIATNGGPAIRTANQALVENSGVIAGSVLLGAGSTFNNREAGRLHSGDVLNMATLNNAGILNPGGENALDGASFTLVRTRLDGSLQQTGSGRYAPDLDYYRRQGDFLAVAEPSRFEGKVTPLPVRALRDIPLQIATFAKPLAGYDATIDDRSPVFRYNLNRPDPQSIAIAMSADFAPKGLALSEDQANKAAYLQGIWNAQGPDAPADKARDDASRIFGYVSRAQSEQAYRDALDEIGNDATGARGAAMANEARAFAERLNSCPAFTADDARMREVDCVWGRSIATRIDRSGSAEDSGYGTKQLTLQVGGQRQVQPGWFLGGSLGYDTARTTTRYDDVEIRSQGVMAGAVLKREIGPWLFSASLLAGYDTADLKRDILLSSSFFRASGTSHALQLGGKLRASYQAAFGSWYLKPMVDLDIHFIKQYGYRERGAGIFDLTTLDQNQFGAMVSPALEIGSRFELAGMVSRAYLNAGASFVSWDGWQQKQRFEMLGSGGLPSFSSETGMPRIYGNAKAGIDLVTASGWELRAEYGLRAASGYREQTAELRAALRF